MCRNRTHSANDKKQTAKSVLFVLLIVLFCIRVHGENTDTIPKFIASIPSDTNGIKLLLKAADNLAFLSGENALKLNQEAVSRAKNCGIPRIYADALMSLSNRLMTQAQYTASSEYLLIANRICDSINYLPGQIRVLVLTGNMFAYQKQGDEAVKYYLLAMPLVRKTGNISREATLYNNIGILYYNRGEKDSSMFPVSRAYFDSSYALAKKANDIVRILTAMNNLAMVYSDLKNFNKVRQLSDSIISLSREIADSADIAYGYSHLGRAYLELHKYDSAIYAFTITFDLAKRVGDLSSISNTYEGLSNAWAGKKNFKKAYENHLLYFKFNDSLVNTSSIETITTLRNTISAERKANVIDKLKESTEIGELVNTRKNLFLIGAIIVVVFAIAFALFIFSRARSREQTNRKLNEQNTVIARKNKYITESIEYASQIQQVLLARKEVVELNLADHFIFFKPKDIVSGDFYWCAENDDSFYLAVCDSTGHGVPGAFMSLLNISFLNEAVIQKNIRHPDEILNYCRARLLETISKEGAQDGMDGCIIRIGKSSKTISYAAAYNAPILVRGGEVISLSADKMPIGKSEKTDLFTRYETDINPGEMMYLLTDGFADQFGGSQGKKLKMKALKEKLMAISLFDSTEQEKQLRSFFDFWRGSLEQVDDVLLIGFKMNG
jgi:tetratricopeptide (TPR) repeat protein